MLKFKKMSQSGFILETGNDCLVCDIGAIDLMKNFMPEREEFGEEPVFLTTHEHGDHFHVPVASRMHMAFPKGTFVFPEFMKRTISEGQFGKKMAFLKKGKSFGDYNILSVTKCPHLLPCVGYVIEADGKVIYHSGDLEPTDEDLGLKEYIGKIDLYIAANGGPNSKYKLMNPEEIANFAKKIGAKKIVLGHCDNPADNDLDPETDSETITEICGIECLPLRKGDEIEI